MTNSVEAEMICFAWILIELAALAGATQGKRFFFNHRRTRDLQNYILHNNRLFEFV